MPKHEFQELSPIGTSISPHSESKLNTLSASSLLSKFIAILLTLSLSLTLPQSSGTSLPMSKPLSIGNTTCIILPSQLEQQTFQDRQFPS